MRRKWLYSTQRTIESTDGVIHTALQELRWRGGGFLIPIELPSPAVHCISRLINTHHSIVAVPSPFTDDLVSLYAPPPYSYVGVIRRHPKKKKIMRLLNAVAKAARAAATACSNCPLRHACSDKCAHEHALTEAILAVIPKQ